MDDGLIFCAIIVFRNFQSRFSKHQKQNKRKKVVELGSRWGTQHLTPIGPADQVIFEEWTLIGSEPDPDKYPEQGIGGTFNEKCGVD